MRSEATAAPDQRNLRPGRGNPRVSVTRSRPGAGHARRGRFLLEEVAAGLTLLLSDFKSTKLKAATRSDSR